MKTNIKKYRVKMMDNNPMYGKSKLVKNFDTDKNNAIEWAKKNCNKYNSAEWNMYVEESTYTSEDNEKRDFAITRDIVWGSWW